MGSCSDMLTIPHLVVSALLVPAAQDAPAPSAHWGQFRGPNGSGTATGGLPDVLDAEETLLWAVEIPSGYSSPVVGGGRVFVTAATKDKLVTLCMDEETGEQVWEREVDYDGKRPGANSSAAPTPATDGEHVYALFHHIGMIAYDMDGEELWMNDLGAPFNIPHGLATSPVVHGGKILVQLDQDTDSALVCLDAETGDEVWRTERSGASHSYSTPAIHAPAEGPAMAIVSGSYQIAGYSMETGERVWWVSGSAWQSKAVPLIHGNRCIVSAYMASSSEFGLPPMPEDFADVLAEHDADDSGTISRDEWDHDMMQQTWFIWDRNGDDILDADDYTYLRSTQTAKGGMFAIELGGKGDVSETHVAWTYDARRGLSDLISPVLLGDTIYCLRDGGILTAFDAKTGEKQNDGRIGEPDQYYASPVAAGGRMLFTGMSGQLTVVEPGEEWETVSTTSVDAGRLWSTPALAEGKILVRGQSKLFCFERP
ncbi:MAG: PQQ-binding-like beta-propeller repeat protein [Planctomycetota bacterium]